MLCTDLRLNTMSFMTLTTTTVLFLTLMMSTYGQDCSAEFKKVEGFFMYGRKYCLHFTTIRISADRAVSYCSKAGATLPYPPAGDSLTTWQKALYDASPSRSFPWAGASYVNGTAAGWKWTAAATAVAGATHQGVVPQEAWGPGEPIEGDNRTCTRVSTSSGKLEAVPCSGRQEVLCQAQPVKDCGQLQSPQNGRVIGEGHMYGDKVTFACNIGYELIGADGASCLDTGIWSVQIPQCKRKDCGQLQSPQNGRVIGEGHMYGDNVTFACDIGHELVGADGASCLDTGIWSVQIPQCKRGCPSGFELYGSKYCLHWNPTDMSAGEAASYCSTKAAGATLPYLPAGDSLTTWQNAVDEAIAGSTWGGASYVSGAGWLWTAAAASAGASPQVVPQQAWRTGEPEGDGTCTFVGGSSGRLLAVGCSSITIPVLCQVPAGE